MGGGGLSVGNLPKAVGGSCSKSMFSYEILDYTEDSVSVKYCGDRSAGRNSISPQY